jgi:uncharacterized protein (TIGR02118 family)
MFKIVFCLRRLPGIEPEEFSSYWRSSHAELFRCFAKSLGVVRYTQSHYYPNQLNAGLRSSRHAPEAYDGVAEVWFDSLDDLLGGLSSPEGRAAGEALILDERRFIDHANSPIWIADEIEIGLD